MNVIISDTLRDEKLRKRFADLTKTDSDYWSFRCNARREHGHGLLQYPAMMVPKVARTVLMQACAVHPEIERVGDPYAGSGTVLTESMLKGLSFSGTDINPLAILLCRVKAGPFFTKALTEKTNEVIANIGADSCDHVEVDFKNINKWFQSDVQINLSKIRRAILREGSPWARRFFWIALAEAVRLTSNSRTSTFKLHIRPENELRTRICDAIGVFNRAVTRNIKHMDNQAECLSWLGHLHAGRYQEDVSVKLGDSRKVEQANLCDIIITSPPYGDNATTVPYGQYSYLPLQWIELEDIDSDMPTDCLSSTHEIDTQSLGGSKRIEKEHYDALADRSPTFKAFHAALNDQPDDRSKRVTAFFRDLDACIPPILGGLRPGGLMIWTLGNRKVGGMRVPLDEILSELLACHNSRLLCKLARRIPSKRMAIKNNIAETISSEAILVMRKGAGNGK